MQKGITIFRWKNFVWQCRKFSLRNLCFGNSLVPKNVRDKRGARYHDFPSKLFCLSTEKLGRGTLRCFRKFLVSKNFMLQRVMSRFSFESFLSHSTEAFRRSTILCCVSETFCYRKMLRIRERKRGGVSRFSGPVGYDIETFSSASLLTHC